MPSTKVHSRKVATGDEVENRYVVVAFLLKELACGGFSNGHAFTCDGQPHNIVSISLSLHNSFQIQYCRH